LNVTVVLLRKDARNAWQKLRKKRWKMNKKIGMYASLVTLAAVVVFAVSMIVGDSTVSYLASMMIAWGFIPM
jgi:hypothetical protein